MAPLFIVREHELCQSNFIFFSHGKSLLEVWLTMPLELMMSSGTPICMFEFRLRQALISERGLFTMEEAAVILDKCRALSAQRCRVGFCDENGYSHSLACSIMHTPTSEVKLIRPIKDTYCPFRSFEVCAVVMYPHACAVMSSTTLLGEAIRLRDQAMVREARDELLAEAERASGFYV